ncbi:MAG: hypothetical protein ABJB09_00110 [Verrucomicrobiota bacterium]
MIKFKGLALIAAAVFAVTSAYAGDKACCAAHGKTAKMDCSKTYAQLNLTTEQKTKLETAEADCKKAGCTKESMENFMKSAEGIMTKEQFATFKSKCSMEHAEKKQG